MARHSSRTTTPRQPTQPLAASVAELADRGVDHRDKDTGLLQLRRTPLPGSRGWAVPGGGYAAHVDAGDQYQGTTFQLAGLFPFIGGSGSRTRGVPIGYDLLTHEPVGLDPALWLQDGLVTNTGIWIQAQPGVGKSAFCKRLVVGLVAQGWFFFMPADVKGEYTELVKALGGSVFVLRRGGRHRVNPLSAGPLRYLLSVAKGEDKISLEEAVRARRIALIDGLLTLKLRRPMTATEESVFAAAIDVTAAAERNEPTLPQLLAVLDKPTGPLLDKARVLGELPRYFDLMRDAINALDSLVHGPLRGLFDGPSTVDVDPATPAVSLDISALDEEADEVIATAMLCSWAWGSSMIESTRMAREAGGVDRNILWVQDEMWRALRTAAGLVEKSDRMTRLNRQKGVASVYLTHSMDDLEALASEEDRSKARGIAARCGIHVYGGLSESDLNAVARVVSVSAPERNMIASWQAAPTWMPGQKHPGRGRYMIKSGARKGLPVEMVLSPQERELFDTDRAFAGRAR